MNTYNRRLVFVVLFVLALIVGQHRFTFGDDNIVLPNTPEETTIVRLFAGGFYLIYVPIMVSTGEYPDRCQLLDGVPNFLNAYGVPNESTYSVTRPIIALLELCVWKGGN